MSPHCITSYFRLWNQWFVRISGSIKCNQSITSATPLSKHTNRLEMSALPIARPGLRHRLETPLPLLHHLPRRSWIYIVRYKINMWERERERSLRAYKVRYALYVDIYIYTYVYICIYNHTPLPPAWWFPPPPLRPGGVPSNNNPNSPTLECLCSCKCLISSL